VFAAPGVDPVAQGAVMDIEVTGRAVAFSRYRASSRDFVE
jgi:hypothetical protein